MKQSGNLLLAIVGLGFACGDEVRDVRFEPGSRDDNRLVGIAIEGDIKDRLLTLPGVELEELLTTEEGVRVFSIKFEQPVDHDNPDSPRFKQRIVLRHRSDNAPMVLETTGYGLGGLNESRWANYVGEVAEITGGSQLIYEHRYFEESLPAPGEDGRVDFSYLTTYQAASDAHAIRTLFGRIYRGRWLATGASKGGMTSLFHHYYYRNDLDGVVPYVAPITFGLADVRYDEFFETIGPADGVCRTRLRELAIEAIQRREEIAAVLPDSDAALSVLRSDIRSVQTASEAYGMEWPTWQYSGTPEMCAELPEAGASPEDFFPYVGFEARSVLGGSSSRDARLSPYYYQVRNELGSPYYGGDPELDEEYSKVDLSILPPPPERSDSDQSRLEVEFDPSVMLNVDTFLRGSARRIVAVYGEWDPWTAGKITLAESFDNAVYIVAASDHSTRFEQLPNTERKAAQAAIRRMAGVTEETSLRPSLRYQAETRGHSWLMEQISRIERDQQRF